MAVSVVGITPEIYSRLRQQDQGALDSTLVQTARFTGKQNFILFSVSKCVILAKLFVSSSKMGAVEICLKIPPHRAVLRVK